MPLPFGKSKREIAELRARNEQLEQLLTPELQDIDNATKKLAEIENENSKLLAKQEEISAENEKLIKKRDELQKEIHEKEKRTTEVDDILLVEEYGLYKPLYDFANSTQYKDALNEVRQEEREAIKEINRRAKTTTNWTVDGSKAKGRKMVGETQRLLLRAFNIESDDLIAKVKTSNIDRTIERIENLASTISKLGSTMHISIPNSYTKLKIKETRLAYEYAKAKEEEKEALREAREQEREERRVQKEIEDRRKQLKKEQTQYEKVLKDLDKRLSDSDITEDETNALHEKESEIKNSLEEIEKGLEDVDYREANKRAGYVYIISNIGSLGENVYKIGLTRRLDPTERVRELGDASVPFNFDIHALIFSENAPQLEADLHKEFESRKMNLVNARREFFQCTLDEIKEAVIRNHDKTVEFTDLPEAEQFRTSQKMRQTAEEQPNDK